MRGHETIDHTADMGIQGWGGTRGEAFEEIALAMFELMVDGRGIAATKEIPISRVGNDLTELLIEFLNALLSTADITGTIFLKTTVRVLERRGDTWALEAVASGVPIEEARDKLLVEVKAATFYGASVRESDGGVWVARCVVDL